MEGSEPCPEGVELKGKGGNPQKYPNLRVPGDTQPAHVSACMAYDGTPPQKKNLRRPRLTWAIPNRQGYSSEASSRTPSSMRDLSRKEKLSRIVLRWLPSG